MGRLTALVLGSAAGGGFPQWNCRCPTCRLAWAGDARVRPRTQASLAVSADGENWFLINASPDLPQQIRQSKVLHPRSGTRGSPIKAVVLTGAEIDQVAGLLSLREREPFMVCATPVTLADLVFFDGTLFRDDEMITSGTGAKTGRRMGHMPIDGEDGSLAALEGLAGRRVYVHINNTNPILIDGSPERVHIERKGWEVAED